MKTAASPKWTAQAKRLQRCLAKYEGTLSANSYSAIVQESADSDGASGLYTQAAGMYTYPRLDGLAKGCD